MRQPLTSRTTPRRIGLAAAGIAALALAAPAVASAADAGSSDGAAAGATEQAQVLAAPVDGLARTTEVCGGAVAFDDAELQQLIDEGKVIRAIPLDQAGPVEGVDIVPGEPSTSLAATITIERLDDASVSAVPALTALAVPGLPALAVPGLPALTIPALPALPTLPADAVPGVAIGLAQPC